MIVSLIVCMIAIIPIVKAYQTLLFVSIINPHD